MEEKGEEEKEIFDFVPSFVFVTFVFSFPQDGPQNFTSFRPTKCVSAHVPLIHKQGAKA